MLHLLLVTDSAATRARLASLLPEIEWLSARSGDDAIDVLGRSSRVDAIVLTRGFFELDEAELLPSPEPGGEPRRLRADQGFAVAAAIRSEIPGNLPISILDTEPDEIPKELHVFAWPRSAMTPEVISSLVERLLSSKT